MEPSMRREPLNYALVLLLFALIAYAAIGLTLRAEPAAGEETRGADVRVNEPGVPLLAEVRNARDAATSQAVPLDMP
jgi:hypothetical protein